LAAGFTGAFETTLTGDFFGAGLASAGLTAAFFGAAFLADAFAAAGRAGFLLAVAFDFLLMFGCLSGAARAGESNPQEYGESLDFSRHQRL
jgi:predicted permease